MSASTERNRLQGEVKGANLAMLVQCPSCSARYRVNASNIPSTGGRIRCPSCEHTFVVYPEAPAQPAPQAASYEEAKTSIANIQDLMQGANALRQQQQSEAEDDGATEIMSGASLPNFSNLFGGQQGGGAPERVEDGTVEMQNPLALLKSAGLAQEEEDGATEIVSADMMFGLGNDPFAAPAQPTSPAPASPAPSYPPAASATSSAQPAYAPSSHQPPAHQPPSHQSSYAPQRTVSTANDATQVTGADALGDFSFPPPASSSPSGQALGSALFGGGPPADTVEAASPFAAPAPAPVAAAPAGGSTMDPSYQGPWKLKTSFGLTYEFQDTASLQTWMSSRDDLSGYTLAGDDEQFRELGVYPQLGGGAPPSAPTMAMHRVTAPAVAPLPHTPAPTTAPMPSPLDQRGGFEPPPPQPASPRQPGARITNTEYKPPRGNRRWVTIVLFLLFTVFGAGAVGLSLHIFKIVDMKQLLGVETPAPKPTPKPPEVAKPKVDKPPEEKKDTPPAISDEAKLQAKQFIKEAEVNIENNKLPPARQVLEKALRLDPTNLKTYDLLADTYDKLGQADKATETREKVKQLRADSNDSGGDDVPPPELTP